MTTTTSQRELMEGSEALVRAAIAADCKFFAGYPMTPFTEVLEHFARLLPEVDGVCINAESELEAVGMAWGAVSAGARAATAAGATHVREVADADEAEELLRAELRPGDVVLLKSSRDAGLRLLGDRLAGPREEHA